MAGNKRADKLQKSLSSIDGFLVALNNYPTLEDAALDRAQQELQKLYGRWFPTQIDFMQQILEHLIGKEKLINIISKLLVYELPAIEAAIKAALIANVNSLGGSCEIDPIIYREAILNGITFDLSQIDLYDKLTVSPLDKKIGQYFYFGVEDCESAYDILQKLYDPENKRTYTSPAKDFDCLLWYMKNKSVYREVWAKRHEQPEADLESQTGRYPEGWGTVTLEYSPRAGNVKDSEGNPMLQQTPYDNVLHVFFGNVKEFKRGANYDDEMQKYSQYLHSTTEAGEGVGLSTKIEEINKAIDHAKEKLRAIKKKYEKYNKKSDPDNPNQKDKPNIERKKKECETLTNLYQTFIDNMESLLGRGTHYNYDETQIQNYFDAWNSILPDLSFKMTNETQIAKFNKEFSTIQPKLKGYKIYGIQSCAQDGIAQVENAMYFDSISGTLRYPSYDRNYYYHKTIMQFNTNYIMSLQLFDAKVLTAQLITAMLGGIVFDAAINTKFSWKQEFIRETVEKMVQKTIAAQDYEVSDCFFTFSNDTINDMMRATELRAAGLYTQNGEENGTRVINTEELLNGLNNISASADKQSQKTIVEGALMEAAGVISTDTYSDNSHLTATNQFGLQMSFLDNLLTNLCTQMVMAILSPKVYLLILINLELYGFSTNLSLRMFIERFYSLIQQMVKSVIDEIMKYLQKEIIELLEQIAKQLAAKLSLEKAMMWIRLIRQIIIHLKMLLGKFGSQAMGFTVDKVNYADIAEEQLSQEPIDEC